MLNFASDYTEGCHAAVLQALADTNPEQLTGYGTDTRTASAIEKLRRAIGKPQAEITLLTGGTQTNQVVIDAILTRCEGVIAAATGHVAVHEAGAIEYSGHKVLTLPAENGKLDAAALRRYLVDFYNEEAYDHMVLPGMVYISHPTELGTLYTKAELTALAEVCRAYRLPLFLDGARLGYGLMSRGTDVTLGDIADLTDVFYIGGTKVGALCGEAVVFPRGGCPKQFVTLVKQHGALLAKGRLTGVQFEALFTDDLYFRIARNAIDRAEELKAAVRAADLPFYLESPTNQQFIILENDRLAALAEQVVYTLWGKYDQTRSVIRLCTSWATTPAQIDALSKVLQKL